ncbi:MerR family transcriptional regulator [Altererythrobacter salegens]|uniref:MerR family transcriptional regulator n=1 Tax=Croceibacterium salegens TaxID=1737568 RepID=A0A6I4STN6_9SPHN|nr:MerR family transcriptional regulator [Croceibacterium salegens]MXO58879.1 MerR family transcriptional regulator [Croceibacterium salegens]
MAMRISELARAGGVGIETVRFYQRKGLLTVPSGDAPTGRHYDSSDLQRLRYIRQAQTAGFTLAEIEELLHLHRTDDRARAREMAKERIEALDEHIAALQSARQSLARLANECAGGVKGPCPILDAFDEPGVMSSASA